MVEDVQKVVPVLHEENFSLVEDEEFDRRKEVVVTVGFAFRADYVAEAEGGCDYYVR